ncbi:MAG: NAD-dependent epimerase/dehydratase family protein [Kofleriaceae bacterium]
MKRAFVTGGSGFVGGALLEALKARGVESVALVRSETAAAKVRDRGAVAVIGSLSDENQPAVVEAMRGCDVLFHSAATTKEYGDAEEFWTTNVGGTKAMLALAKQAGIARFVHVSTEAVLADGHPIIRADETTPYPKHPAGLYPTTKGEAERIAIAGNAIVIRPRFIWGRGDTSLMPTLIEAVNKGRFGWIGGGHFLTSTCNIDNVIEGAFLAAEKGKPGQVYFLTDGEPVDFRDFLTKLLATQGCDASKSRSVPKWVAKLAATATGWMKHPMVTKTAIALVGGEVTVIDAKARRELGYTGAKTIEAGLAEMT